MKTKRSRYLNYIEDTRIHHGDLNKSARRSVSRAIHNSQNNSVPVTYLDGEDIVKSNKNGDQIVIGSVENNRRKVEVGTRTSIPKR